MEMSTKSPLYGLALLWPRLDALTQRAPESRMGAAVPAEHQQEGRCMRL
jgi:hypothetical protein